MRIAIVTPARAGSRHGNRVTALRWARILRELGHRVRVTRRYDGGDVDLLVALHARRSAASVRRFRGLGDRRPLVLALTGTDLYHDLRTSAVARRSLELADRLVVLQPEALAALPPHLRARARVIYQSVRPGKLPARPRQERPGFVVCVLGHLRAVKDPFRTALAARALPAASSLAVVQAGAAMTAAMARRANREMERNPRYRWLGSLSHRQALRQLGASDLLCLTSRLEGGANVISEAIALSVPVVASRIAGTIGLLGAAYPGLFPCGDTRALAALLRRVEEDRSFYRELLEWCRGLRLLVAPARERDSWRSLLEELA